MPPYNNPGGDNMYSDAPEPEPNTKPQEDGDENAGETTLVPSSLCPGMKPGDEMVVKIVRVMDDQYEIAYAPEKGKEEPAEEPQTSNAPSPDMASLME